MKPNPDRVIAGLVRRIADTEKWLSEQGVDVKQEQAHLDKGSRERLYWHYGYLMGIKDAHQALTIGPMGRIFKGPGTKQ